jgi:hypothetical protein
MKTISASRILLAAIVVAVLYGAAFRAQRAQWAEAVPSQVAVPALPKSLPAAWTACDIPPDPDAPERPLDAISGSRQAYRNAAGAVVSVEVDAFQESPFLPHPPEICYENAGALLVEGKEFPLQRSGGPPLIARLLTIDRSGRRLHVLYWYQMGRQVFYDSDGLLRAKWASRGQPQSLPIIKVMLQAAAGDFARAENQLQSVAQPLAVWALRIH